MLKSVIARLRFVVDESDLAAKAAAKAYWEQMKQKFLASRKESKTIIELNLVEE